MICDICYGHYPESKHNFEQCYSLDLDWDIIMMDKYQIIYLWRCNLKGKKFNVTSVHCGHEGHFIERAFGIRANGKNAPDILGFELKKYSNKITFGDWSASEYLFTKNNSLGMYVDVKEFLRIFGTPNKNKHNRISWSGSCVPVVKKWNTCGQRLFVENDDIIARYDPSYDVRDKKFIKCTIAVWKRAKMERHVNNKFNKRGFIIASKDRKGVYNKLSFGKKISFEMFITWVKKGIVIFDSGMYSGNSRHYSSWRASSKLWDHLIIEEYQ